MVSPIKRFAAVLSITAVAVTVAAQDQSSPAEPNEYVSAREAMVQDQIEARGIEDERVLKAMREVPRHLFVDESQREYAYEDHPLPIGEDQTISQPYIVALMTELLQLEQYDKVLEIGTGSGYQAAVLGEISDSVFTNARYTLNHKFPNGDGKKKLTIEASIREVGGEQVIAISFRDSGEGIPPEIIDQVTKPFFSTKPKGEGTGLGLSISRDILRSHGGDLNIESLAGEFTTVTVDLPAVRA